MALPALPPVDSANQRVNLLSQTSKQYMHLYSLAALPPVVEAGAFPPVEAGALEADLGGILIGR